jgi:hypothetical protein
MNSQEARETTEIGDIITTVIQNVWDNLSLQTINRLVDEMPQPMIQVIRNQGHTLQQL